MKENNKIIKKIIKIGFIILLVCISIPTISLLYLQNKKVQTLTSEYFLAKAEELLGNKISVSSVHYSFFKRLSLYDFYIEDQRGDTLIYSEVTKIRIKKFRPDIKDIQLKFAKLENALVQINVYEGQGNSMKFMIDSLRRNRPPEEKQVIRIDHISLEGSRYKMSKPNFEAQPGSMDFSDLEVENVNVRVEDFLIRQDTVSMNVKHTSGIESCGFQMRKVSFNLAIGKKFMTFSQANIQTPNTTAFIPIVDFKFNHAKNFKQFHDSVELHIASKNSLLHSNDVGYFFPVLKKLNGTYTLDGQIYGKLNNLTGKDIIVKHMENSYLNFDMQINGLPKKDSVFLNIDLNEFATKIDEFNSVIGNFNPQFQLNSKYLDNIGVLKIKGDFKGFINDFRANGMLSSNLGLLSFNAAIDSDSKKNIYFDGDISAEKFHLGKFFNLENSLGSVDLGFHLEGIKTPEDLYTSISGSIDTLDFKGYRYKDMRIKGKLSNGKYDGGFTSSDPNLNLDFFGSIDLNNEIRNMDFTLDVKSIKPYYLNLTNTDSMYLASFIIKTKLSGSSVNDMNGDIELVNSNFQKTGETVSLNNVILSVENFADSALLKLKSEPLYASVTGKYDLTNLPHTVISMVNDHLNVIPVKDSIAATTTSFAYQVDIRDVKDITSFFLPKLRIGNNSNLNGYYQTMPDGYIAIISGYFSNIGYDKISMEKLKLSSASDTNIFSIRLDSEKIYSGNNFEIKYPEIVGTFKNNTNSINLIWRNDTMTEPLGSINTRGQLKNLIGSDSAIYTLFFEPSHFYYNSTRYSINKSNISFQKNGYEFDSLIIRGGNQFILADGKYSSSNNASLNVELNNFNLNLINQIYKPLLIDFSGEVSGITRLKNESGKPVILSDLYATDIALNKEPLGNANISADWLRNNNQLHFLVSSDNDSVNNIFIDGNYHPKSDNILADMVLEKVKFKAFEPYFKESISNITGSGTVDMKISGKINKPELNGTFAIHNSSALIKATQTSFFIDDTIVINNNNLSFNNFDITDSYGSKMVINGSISNKQQLEPYINLSANAENFNFLSTSIANDKAFYGDVFATTDINITGPLNQVNVSIIAATEKNTKLKLPLFNPDEVKSSDFISFYQPDPDLMLNDVDSEAKPKRKFSLDMELAVMSNAEIQLIFDPSIGDIIQASGNGNLNIELQQDGDVELYGDVSVVDGEYLFTLQNVINKKFKIKPGGTLSWNGSPTDVNLNLDAIYETKASTYNLAPNPTADMKKRIPVYCLLSLEGNINNPSITPSIELPTAEPETRSIVETSIGTEEDLMRQFISLLVINNFISNAETGRNPVESFSGSGLAGITASELLSNQLSNWLSQISNDFDIGVNYRPGDNISSDEVEVALSTQLLNDRIILSGNLDVIGDDIETSTDEASNIVGDFDLEFKITEKISLKAFNRVNDDRIIRSSIYTQGVGVLYRNEFNKISELFNKTEKDQRKNENPAENKGDAVINNKEE